MIQSLASIRRGIAQRDQFNELFRVVEALELQKQTFSPVYCSQTVEAYTHRYGDIIYMSDTPLNVIAASDVPFSRVGQ